MIVDQNVMDESNPLIHKLRVSHLQNPFLFLWGATVPERQHKGGDFAGLLMTFKLFDGSIFDILCRYPILVFECLDLFFSTEGDKSLWQSAHITECFSFAVEDQEPLVGK